MRIVVLTLLLALAGCGAATGPAGEQTRSSINPETGSRGGGTR